MILAFILIVHTLSDNHLYQYWPPDQQLTYDVHVVHRHYPEHSHLRLMMADVQYPHDPKAPLSPTDLARLLMQYCSDRIKEERAHTKELIDDKAELVITGVIRGMGEGLATITESMKDYSQKLESLELKLSYLEKLFYQQMLDQTPVTSSPPTRTCLVCIKNPESNPCVNNQNKESHFHCNACITVFLSVKDLYHHICTPHAITSHFSCWNCEETFVNEKLLEEHNESMHASKTSITGELCDEALSPVLELGMHQMSHGCDRDLSSQVSSSPTTHTTSDHEKSSTPLPHQVCHMPSDLQHSQLYHLPPEASHEYLHQEIYHSTCEVCGFITTSNDHIRNHKKHCHGIRDSELHCNMCRDTFVDMRELNIHLKEHHQSDTLQLNKDHHNHNNDTLDFSDILQVDGIDDLTLSEVSHTGSAGVTLHDPTLTSASESFPNSAQAEQQLMYTLNPLNQARRLFENTDRPPLDIKYNNLQIIRGKQHPTNVTIECNSGLYLTAIKPALEAISAGWKTEVLSIVISCEDMSEMRDLSGRKVCTKLVLYLKEQQSISKQKVVLHFYHTSCTVQAQGSSLMSCGTCSPVWLVKHYVEPLASMHATTNRETIQTLNTNIRDSATFTCGHCKTQISPTASNPKDQELPCSKCGVLYHKRCTTRRRSTGNWKRSPWYCETCLTGPPSSSIPAASQSHHAQQSSVSPGQCAVSLSAHPTSQLLPPRFPSTSTRQRSSNVNLGNAEQEFQKTALGALRSTVTQQEVELKSLKEAIDIRNKRISQLEAQVGHASNLLADRRTPEDLSGDRVSELVEKLNRISEKFDQLAGVASNNIVVNTCNSRHSLPEKRDSATQTDAAHPNQISEGLHSELPGPQAPPDAGGGQEHEGGSHPVQEHSNSPNL